MVGNEQHDVTGQEAGNQRAGKAGSGVDRQLPVHRARHDARFAADKLAT